MPRTTLHSSFDGLPRETIAGGAIARSAVRGDSALTVFNWIEPELDEQPPHDHPFDQLALILQGTAEFDVGGQTYRVAAGELLYIPAGVPHTLRVLGSQRVLNVDLFAPARQDYLHLTDHQPD